MLLVRLHVLPFLNQNKGLAVGNISCVILMTAHAWPILLWPTSSGIEGNSDSMALLTRLNTLLIHQEFGSFTSSPSRSSSYPHPSSVACHHKAAILNPSSGFLISCFGSLRATALFSIPKITLRLVHRYCSPCFPLPRGLVCLLQINPILSCHYKWRRLVVGWCVCVCLDLRRTLLLQSPRGKHTIPMDPVLGSDP